MSLRVGDRVFTSTRRDYDTPVVSAVIIEAYLTGDANSFSGGSFYVVDDHDIGYFRYGRQLTFIAHLTDEERLTHLSSEVRRLVL